MGYVNAVEILKEAFKGKYAVGHFNINNLIWAKTILEVCEVERAPVIIAASEGGIKFMGGYNVVASIVKSLINDLKVTIPVVLHLDHGSSFESCEKAIVAGFSSVMLDKSKESLEINIRESQKVSELARKYGVSLEIEVGIVGGNEDGVVGESMYAKIDDCRKIIEEVDLDFFAPALGSVHGHYKGEPKLAFDRMKQISELFKIPLVLHGGSGIPDYQIKKAISNGISKINVSTELQEAYNRGLRDYYEKNMDKLPKGYDSRKHIAYANKWLKEAITKKIRLFGSNNKA